jgi:hypothetical protein
MKRAARTLALALAVAGLAVGACGSPAGVPLAYPCCIDGAFYGCPTPGSADRCARQRETTVCARDANHDLACE